MMPAPEIAKENILVVDDTVNNLRLLSTILKRQDYVVREALSGQAALATIHQQIPDLILLDIGMPEMNGYEVCKQLRASEQTANIPVIFISAYDAVMDKVKGFEVGGVDYITKPFHLAEVVARVENQLNIRRLSRQLQRKNEQLEQEIQERANVESALRIALKQLKTLANLDGLTHIANRRRFDEFLSHHWELGQSLALILTDVDYFKAYNDTYGHLEGDRCLQQVAQALQSVLARFLSGQETLLARYGGEEFGILVADAQPSQVIQLAHCCHQKIHRLQIPHQGAVHAPHLTMSFGVAIVQPTPEQSINILIDRADQSLYQAKAEGRDRVVIYDESS